MAVGGMGRPRKPTKVAELQGYRKDRMITDTPTPGTGVDVEPPPELSTAGREEWQRLAPDLIAKGVLTGWDTHAFAHYCDAVVRLWNASERLNEEGEVIEVPNVSKTTGKIIGSTTRTNPWMQVYKELSQDVARWAARFGLTPTDRATLSISSDKKTPGADLLTG